MTSTDTNSGLVRFRGSDSDEAFGKAFASVYRGGGPLSELTKQSTSAFKSECSD